MKSLFDDKTWNLEPEYQNRSRGRVQGVHTPPPLQNDLQVSNITSTLQKMESCGLLVLR